MTTTLTSDEREMIGIGDRVRVEFWQGKDDICGDVVYLPTQVGDSWIIRTEDRLFYLQHFAAISKRKEATDTSPRPPTVNTGRGRCIHNVPICGDCEITGVLHHVVDNQRTASDAATQMRDKCVEKVKAMGEQWRQEASKAGRMFSDKTNIATQIATALESLTLDNGEQEQK